MSAINDDGSVGKTIGRQDRLGAIRRGSLSHGLMHPAASLDTRLSSRGQKSSFLLQASFPGGCLLLLSSPLRPASSAPSTSPSLIKPLRSRPASIPSASSASLLPVALPHPTGSPWPTTPRYVHARCTRPPPSCTVSPTQNISSAPCRSISAPSLTGDSMRATRSRAPTPVPRPRTRCSAPPCARTASW